MLILPQVFFAIALLLFVFWAVSLFLRYFRSSFKTSKILFERILVAHVLSILIIVGNLSSERWIIALGTFALHASAIFAYLTILQIHKQTDARPLYESQYLWSMLPFAICGGVLFGFFGYERIGGTLQSIMWNNYLINIYNYTFHLILILKVIHLLYTMLRQYTEASFLLRIGIHMAAYSISSITLCVTIPMTTLTLFHPAIDARGIDTFNIYIVSISALLIATGLSIPTPWLAYVGWPLQHLLVRRQEEYHQQLLFLHHCLVQIVPGVRLRNEQTYTLRTLIEISDARQIIWSQKDAPCCAAITPRREALHLVALLEKKIILTNPGMSSPPMVGHSRSYNQKVVLYLQKYILRS